MPVLTKARLADRLVDVMGLPRREAQDLVELFFDTIADTLETNEEVLLTGFGRFRLRDKGERPARNPGTGVPATVSARRVVTFRSSTRLRDTLGRPAASEQAGASSDANP